MSSRRRSRESSRQRPKSADPAGRVRGRSYSEAETEVERVAGALSKLAEDNPSFDAGSYADIIRERNKTDAMLSE